MKAPTESSANPPITPLLRGFSWIELAVLAGAGGSLFFLPDIARQLWPWPLTPFNTRFLGAIYSASFLGVALLVWRGRWEPARLVAPFILTFTIVVLLVSATNGARFEPVTWVTFAWFGLYAALPINSAYYLWTTRGLRSATPVALPSSWRSYLLGQGLIAVAYGLALLVAPADASAFWPWRIDDFHARMYSAAFITGGVGSLILWRGASRIELATLGAIQIGLGALAIAGTAIVDLTVHTVAWTAAGTLIWVGIFAAIVVTGALMVRIGRQR